MASLLSGLLSKETATRFTSATDPGGTSTLLSLLSHSAGRDFCASALLLSCNGITADTKLIDPIIDPCSRVIGTESELVTGIINSDDFPLRRLTTVSVKFKRSSKSLKQEGSNRALTVIPLTLDLHGINIAEFPGIVTFLHSFTSPRNSGCFIRLFTIFTTASALELFKTGKDLFNRKVGLIKEFWVLTTEERSVLPTEESSLLPDITICSIKLKPMIGHFRDSEVTIKGTSNFKSPIPNSSTAIPFTSILELLAAVRVI